MGQSSLLENEVHLIDTEAEATGLALAADPRDVTCFVPAAFSGLGAPYWDSSAIQQVLHHN